MHRNGLSVQLLGARMFHLYVVIFHTPALFQMQLPPVGPFHKALHQDDLIRGARFLTVRGRYVVLHMMSISVGSVPSRWSIISLTVIMITLTHYSFLLAIVSTAASSWSVE